MLEEAVEHLVAKTIDTYNYELQEPRTIMKVKLEITAGIHAIL